MANIYSDIAKSGLMLDYAATPGTVLCRTATLNKTYAANDVLYMVPVPKGAMILDVCLVVPTAFAVASSTVDVGDEDDADRYLDGIDVKTAACVKHSDTDGPLSTAFGHVMSKDGFITITNLTAQSAVQKVICSVTYKMVGQLADEASGFDA